MLNDNYLLSVLFITLYTLRVACFNQICLIHINGCFCILHMLFEAFPVYLFSFSMPLPCFSPFQITVGNINASHPSLLLLLLNYFYVVLLANWSMVIYQLKDTSLLPLFTPICLKSLSCVL